MALVATRLLIVNNDLDFAVNIKQALEQIGDYEVSSFTTMAAAYEQLQNRPYNVALVDFTLPDSPGMDIVLRLRSVQSDIAIIACPELPDVAAAVNDMSLNGIVDVPCSARELITVIKNALTQVNEALPDTTEAPAMRDSETLVIDHKPEEEEREFESLDKVLIRMGGFDVTSGSETIDVDMSDAGYAEQKDNHQNIEFVLTGDLSALKEDLDKSEEEPAVGDEVGRAMNVFQRLLEEEPPPPLEESGSVGDLMAGVEDSNPYQVAEMLQKEQKFLPTPSEEPPQEEETVEDSPAQIILETALDETSPNEFSMEDILQNIVRRFPEDVGGVKPLPSWEEEIQRYVSEPEFLPDTLPELEQTDRSNIQTTSVSNIDAVEAHPGDLETDLIPEKTLDAFDGHAEEDIAEMRESEAEASPIPESETLPRQVDESEETLDAFDGYTEEDIAEEPEPEVEVSPISEPETLPRQVDESEETLDAFDVYAEDDVAEEPEPEAEVSPISEPETLPRQVDESEETLDAFDVYAEDNVEEEPESEEKVSPITKPERLPPRVDESTVAAILSTIKALKGDSESESIEQPQSEPITDEVDSETLHPEEEVPVSEDFAPITQYPEENNLPRLVLGLTQASLESTAESTLLARDGEIVAHAGTLSIEDIEELCRSIGGDLEARPNEARIRFVTLPDSGQDYMLYSRQTEGGYTLTMIFAGTMPLRVIRRQSDRLVGALRSVPEALPEIETSLSDKITERQELQLLEEEATRAEEAAQESQQILIREEAALDLEDDLELAPQTYLWLVRDADRPLTDFLADEIITVLDLELYDMGWNVDVLQVTEDYVYILADAPTDKGAQEVVIELKQIAAEIAQKADETVDPDTLWADGYAVLTPGREMDTEEIQQYIDFGRNN